MAIGALLVSVAGCMPNSGDEGSGDSDNWKFDPSARAEVVRETGSITTPYDAYWYSASELADLQSAESLAIFLCAEQKGVVGGTWEPYEPIEIDPRVRTYGIWVRKLVEEYAYQLPPMTPPPPPNNSVEGATDIYLECVNEGPEAERWVLPTMPSAMFLAAELTAASDQVFLSTEGLATQSDWESCIEEAGLQRDHSQSAPWAIIGADDAVTEETLRIALADVTCKEQVDYVERLADLDAGFQQPIIDEYVDELAAQRADIDRIVADARDYLAKNAP